MVEFWLWGHKVKGMFSRNFSFLFIFYIKLDCDAWDQVFWSP